MDGMTRWETEAMRHRGQRPRPRSGTIDLRSTRGSKPPRDLDPEEPPPGTLVVPLDAWQRMLDQLGNLHEAGQQLAEASARAAKAETEAEFLRERVSELRRRLQEAEAVQTGEADRSTGERTASDADEQPRDESLIRIAAGRARSAYRSLRSRRGR